MSERKVLNKYFPPNFDPSLIPRRSIPRAAQQTVRLMSPFNMSCNSCKEFIYKGKKFNARKEEVLNENYYGLKIFRFYIKCPTCSSEITFKTDLAHADYVAEHGCKRNYEPWVDRADEFEASKQARLDEEEFDPMKAAENRMLDSKREMETLDELSDMRSRNARMERVDVDGLMEKLQTQRAERSQSDLTPQELEKLQAEEADEALIRKVFSKVNADGTSQTAAAKSAKLAVSDAHSDSGSSEDDTALPSAKLTVDSSKPPEDTITIKRRADDVPSVHALLSEQARSMMSAPSAKPKPIMAASKKSKPNSMFAGLKMKSKMK